MDIFHALIFGVVEGISEFLPISSTGHLILTSRILGITQTDFLKSFEIAIQLGAISAVVLLYWRMLLVDWRVMQRVAVAFLPTAILGLVFYKMIKSYLLGNDRVVLWALLIGGIVIIAFEMWYKKKEGAFAQNVIKNEMAQMPLKTAFFIGLFQSLAMVPGVSRSAATILGGLSLGLRRKAVVEFSFLLAVPTMLAATALDLIKNASAFSTAQFGLLAAGFLSAFVIAILSVKFLLYFIQKNDFIVFGIYRILLAVVFFMAIK